MGLHKYVACTGNFYLVIRTTITDGITSECSDWVFPETASLGSRHKVGSILDMWLELLFINLKTIKKYSNPRIGQKMTSLNQALTVFF